MLARYYLHLVDLLRHGDALLVLDWGALLGQHRAALLLSHHLAHSLRGSL